VPVPLPSMETLSCWGWLLKLDSLRRLGRSCPSLKLAARCCAPMRTLPHQPPATTSHHHQRGHQ
jgi:hypothetical protein